MVLICMTLFYLPLIPYMPLITGCAALFQYWLEKFMLLRRHKRPEMMGATIAFFFMNLFPYFVLLYGFSNFFWVVCLRTENEVGTISILTAIAYIIMPVRTLLDRCQSEPARKDDMTYENYKFTFVHDYDRTNPVTKKDAQKEYLEKLKEEAGTKEEKEQI